MTNNIELGELEDIINAEDFTEEKRMSLICMKRKIPSYTRSKKTKSAKRKINFIFTLAQRIAFQVHT